MKQLVWRQVTSGFSLHRAETDLGDFRVWWEDDTWFWSFNDSRHSYSSSFTEAKEATQKYYEHLQNKA